MIGTIRAVLVLMLLSTAARLAAQEKYIASYAGFAGIQAP